MRKKIISLILLYGCVVLLLSACSSKSENEGDRQVQAAVEPLSCIAVLPARTSVDQDETVVYAEAQSLEQGATYATGIIKDELKGNPKVRILSSNQIAALVPEISGGISGTVAALGQKLNCDGVLLTTVRRYTQREGTEYSADSPAAVDFDMVLRDSGSGNVLWSADFREKQQSFLSNIFSFTKAKSRGFKWITVEELMEQGIKERLDECPYLR
ncbi:MAG: hypothetical protein GY799_16755 [Desulfobulbaceae bacterium]|nr:hypothetical protein [Desulfobulbaceae bacterium]